MDSALAVRARRAVCQDILQFCARIFANRAREQSSQQENSLRRARSHWSDLGERGLASGFTETAFHFGPTFIVKTSIAVKNCICYAFQLSNGLHVGHDIARFPEGFTAGKLR